MTKTERVPPPEFTYLEGKNDINVHKHGIGFAEAQKLWNGPIVELPSWRNGEMRYLDIGKIGADYWSAIVKYEGAKVHIISVRKAKKEEIALYEKKTR